MPVTEKGQFVAKTDRFVITHVRSTHDVIVTVPTVSVKESGTEWSNSETIMSITGVGKTEPEAVKDMLRNWEDICMKDYGESIFMLRDNKKSVYLTQ